MDSARASSGDTKPRIIIHGGAGNINRNNLPPAAWDTYRSSLLAILRSSFSLLSNPDARALDVATYAVTLLEENPLFNAGKGAVFTRAGTMELEASIMVSNGYRKRGVGCMMVQRVKNPIKLAREMLVRGETANGGGAYGHCQLSGPYVEGLAEQWGVEMCKPEYHFTKRRWEEHKRGLEREKKGAFLCSQTAQEPCIPEPTFASNDPSWDGHEYLPQGTVGAVVLDRFGTVCVATSTGGLTNKLPGRIGDTPTLGAGFWAEEWMEEAMSEPQIVYRQPHLQISAPIESFANGFTSLIRDCLPTLVSSEPLRQESNVTETEKPPQPRRHAVAMSGTGNGDSFLRLNAVRTAAAMSRFSTPNMPLATAVTRMAGPDGELQSSAGDRWGVTGEGEGGIIGIELAGTKAKVVWDFNCGGMFRAWVDDGGAHRCMVFREEY